MKNKFGLRITVDLIIYFHILKNHNIKSMFWSVKYTFKCQG